MSDPETLPANLDRLDRDRTTVERGFWAKLRSAVGRIPFAEDAVAAYLAASDPATPLRVKAVLFGALAYFVLPIDAVPDFVLALGFTDDAAVLLAALKVVGDAIAPQHRIAARAALERMRQA